MTANIFARSALLPEGWAADIRIEIADGRISGIHVGAQKQSGDDEYETIVPGMANLHSHAFQHAMAGLVERRGEGDDSFWTWRDLMYRFALAMTPDDVETVAAMLYARMLEAGFTRVGEFHYLHHNHDGQKYADIGEMAGRIAAASAKTGIGLTLLPVFYAHAGFGAQPPSEGQRRFISTLDSFSWLYERSRAIMSQVDGANIGIAPHSLRAATLSEINTLAALEPTGPIHIHIAEQVAEVEACHAHHGVSPVALLLDNAPVDDRWCMIHATHMTETETIDLAARGAVAGLCPITEANLGDGIFSGPAFRAAGGLFGVGSDSNVSISLAGELRQYEYSQRLGLRVRNAIADSSGSTGRALFEGAIAGGGRALGAPSGLSKGNWADLVSLDGANARHLSRDNLLDGWIFGDGVAVDTVWARGRKRVEGGQHIDRDRLRGAFDTVMSGLMAL